MRIAADKLERVVGQVFSAAGLPESSAQLVASALVENDLVGHTSHGVLRVGSYVAALERGDVDPAARPKIVQERGGTALMDGQRALGQLACRLAMQEAMQRAKEYGVGAIALHNTGHTGRMGSYVVQAAQEGFMGLVLGSGGPKGGAVAPYGGTSRVFNTNPLSWGIPAGKYPAVFADFATSVCAWGKVQAAIDKGESVPEEWLLDAEGKPTTDPHTLREGGALRTFGRHKGYCLAFLVEALAGGLTGVSCAALDDYGQEFALAMLALDISAFQPLDQFRQMVDGLIDATKAADKAKGVEEILVPGEPEWQARERFLREGIEVSAAAWQRIVEAGERHGLEVEEIS